VDGDESDKWETDHHFIPNDSIQKSKHIRRKLELDWGLRHQKATLRRMATQPPWLSRVDGTACEVQADTQAHHASFRGPTHNSQTTAETPMVSVRVPLGKHNWCAVPRRNPRALARGGCQNCACSSVAFSINCVRIARWSTGSRSYSSDGTVGGSNSVKSVSASY